MDFNDFDLVCVSGDQNQINLILGLSFANDVDDGVIDLGVVSHKMHNYTNQIVNGCGNGTGQAIGDTHAHTHSRRQERSNMCRYGIKMDLYV